MERNIGDQLNKAFEAYRQASIEKDNAEKKLQQTTAFYERYTQKLNMQIEDQQQLIKKLKAQLLSSTNPPSADIKFELAPRKQEEEILLPTNHLLDGPSGFRKIHLMENLESAVVYAPKLPFNNNIDNQDMLQAFEAIQGKFQQIKSLTRRQKDNLKRFHGANDTSNDQRFSMPIQCTDSTAEQAEGPYPSALRAPVDITHPATPLASRGVSPEDRDLVDSLTKLSVKFPPSADSEYDFLNSTPERPVCLAFPKKRRAGAAPATAAATAAATAPAPAPAGAEEAPVDAAMLFVYPLSPSHVMPPACVLLPLENVRGPQQPVWCPELCETEDMVTEVGTTPSSSPDKCAFCHAVVPQDRMNSHLFSHFSQKSEASN